MLPSGSQLHHVGIIGLQIHAAEQRAMSFSAFLILHNKLNLSNEAVSRPHHIREASEPQQSGGMR